MHLQVETIRKSFWWVLPALALLIYFPSHQAGLVHDFTGWYERYTTYGIAGITHCFGYHRLQHVMHAIHFIFFKVCGNTPFLWYVLYALAFGGCSYLVFKVTDSICQLFHFDKPWFPIVSSLLFLIHPYNTTAVVWKVCFHYLLATTFILLILLYSIQWIKHGRKIDLIRIYIFYLLSLFTHELTVSVPLMSLVLVLFLAVQRHNKSRQVILFLVIPQLLVLPLYFSATPLLLAQNEKAPLLTEHQIKPDKQIAAVYRYASKHILFTRYWRHPVKERFHQSWNQTSIWLPFFAVSLALIGLFFYFYRRSPIALRLLLFSLLLFAMAIAPFTSAYESYVLYTTNDMYGFSATPFIIIAIVAFTYLFKARIRNVLILLYALLSFIFLVQTIFYWHQSGAVMQSLLNDFRWYDKENVYILASPDNFKGVLMMKSHDKSMLDDHLFVFNNAPPTCSIEDVIQFNMADRSNGVEAVVHTSDSLSIKFKQWGTWHWRHGIGASSYETDKFKVDLALPYYHLKRKIQDKNAVYIYQDDMKWKEVGEWTTQ